MYGWRGRIGLLVPSINTTMETEFWRIAPEGVSVHTARIAGGREGTPEELRNMENASKKPPKKSAWSSPTSSSMAARAAAFSKAPRGTRKSANS
jgi:maleate cis-trans isomerase